MKPHLSVVVCPLAVLVFVVLLSVVPDLFTSLVFGVPAALIACVVLLVLSSGKLGARLARARWQVGGAVGAGMAGLAILAELLATHL